MTNKEAWREQLVQLNERTRVYTAQQWQVPFAYVLVAGVAFNAVDKDKPLLGGVGLLAAGIVGVLARWHMWFNRDGAARAVCWIMKIEDEKPGGQPTTKYRKSAHLPLEVMVSFIAVACGLGGFHLAGVGLGLRGAWEWVLIAVVIPVEGVLFFEAWRRWQKHKEEIG